MRKFLFTVAFVISICSPILGQLKQEDIKLYPEDTTNVVKVVLESKLDKQATYRGIKEFLVKKLPEGVKAIELDDIDNGLLVAKSVRPLHSKRFVKGSLEYEMLSDVSYTLTVEVKDNRFRLKYEDMFVQQIMKCKGMPDTPLKPQSMEKLANNIAKGDPIDPFIIFDSECREMVRAFIADLSNAINVSVSSFDDF